MEEKTGVDILIVWNFDEHQIKPKMDVFGFKSEIVTRHNNFFQICGIIFDLLAISSKF